MDNLKDDLVSLFHKKRQSKIPVTSSYLPSLDDYVEYLKSIWDTKQITNEGPFVKNLERELGEYLGVPYIFFVTSNTLALQIAIQALGLHGEIITTPFSYVKSTSSIVWENCQPVFVDIDPQTLGIDPNLIEAAITERTSGILATHIYGMPCETEKISQIAQKHNLKVLYNAADGFGVKYNEKSLVSYGDIATLSFHATKLFHTGEGGAIVTRDEKLAHSISYMLNLGHRGYEDFWGLGTNAKNTELHAAMGLCILPEVEKIIASRKLTSSWYDELLTGSRLKRPTMPDNVQYNYAYYPVIFESEKHLLETKKMLYANNIFPRRYFYPPLNKLPYVKPQTQKNAEDLSPRILCLPLYLGLDRQIVKNLTRIILKTLKGLN